MARWKLRQPHYLQVPGTEWEYKESDPQTQRQVRRVFEVPLYLDPRERADQNYPQDDAIIVTDKFDRAHPRDIIFKGPPTPDMEPVDDEAEAITQDYVSRGVWKHPIDALDMNYSQSMLSEFERMLALKMTEIVKPMPNLSLGGVSADQFERLQQQVAMLMEQNAKLQAEILEKPKVARRV